LDIFAKAGVAELRIIGQGHQHPPGLRRGLQMKLGSFAVRAAYERISVSTGDPSLLSLGLIWGF
jgi:hypothetical protein